MYQVSSGLTLLIIFQVQRGMTNRKRKFPVFHGSGYKIYKMFAFKISFLVKLCLLW
jgi:hypothetical protein